MSKERVTLTQVTCALVDFRIDAGDFILADHFKTCARNAQYI